MAGMLVILIYQIGAKDGNVCPQCDSVELCIELWIIMEGMLQVYAYQRRSSAAQHICGSWASQMRTTA